MYSIDEIIESRNVAVFGASRDPMKPGSSLIKLLIDTDFKGQVAGVNPQGGDINGIPLYRSVDEIPFSVDLAVLIIPPKAIPPSLTQCAEKGVKGVVIVSEGFAEAGTQGKQYQEEVRNILQSTGMRGFGPNTLGLVNTATGLTTLYHATERMLRPGSIGFVSQSGIFIGALLQYLSSLDELHISKGIGLGNKVDVDECEALTYLMGDDQTRIVGMYLEDIRNGRRFLETAQKAVLEKPVLLLKGGRTPAGVLASASHTGSMAVDDVVLDGALRQAGVLRMENLEELIGTTMGFQWMPLPRGDKIAMVTFSGAQAIMSADAATKAGLGLARLTQETKEKLAGVIATPSKTQNPVDIFPDMMTHGFEKTATEVLRALLEDDGVHGILFISFAVPGTNPFHYLVDVIKEKMTKPVFFSLLGNKNDVETSRSYLDKQRIPSYLFPEMAVRVFSNMLQYARTVGEAKEG